MTALMPEALSNHEEKLGDVSRTRLSCYFTEIEELKDKLVSISARCQCLEGKVAKEQVNKVLNVSLNSFLTRHCYVFIGSSHVYIMATF